MRAGNHRIVRLDRYQAYLFFERSVQYAINQDVPKSRIVAGLPFYGRMWKLDGSTNLEGKHITGLGLSSTRVAPLISKFNGEIHFDQNTQSPFATFTIPKGQNTFVGNTNLTEGEYIIWYENEPSIRAKLSIPLKYGIKGTGSWALYHETPDTWDYYTSALNGIDNKLDGKTYGTGTHGVTTTSVNIRSSATLSGTIIRTLKKDAVVKVTGEPIHVDNHNWYPIKLTDGKNGFVSGNYLRKFDLQELYGQNRYETSSFISNEGWKENADTIVLGRGDVPADALAGSVLAKKLQAPLLLTKSTQLPENIDIEIDRLAPTKIYLLGGKAAISESVQDQLKNKGYSVSRISGDTRYGTAVSIANQVGVKDELILATGMDSPDALSVAPYAGISQIPILLSKPTQLPNELITFVEQNDIDKVTIIGGEAAIGKNVETMLKNLGVQTIQRVKGSDRYETSVEIAKYYKDALNFSDIFFASGNSYVDALPGSPLAATSRSPILLINDNTLPPSVVDFMINESEASPKINILGGYRILPETIRTTLFQTLK